MRMEVSMDDYDNEGKVFGYTMRSFRNAIGDIATPHYPFWNNLMDKTHLDEMKEKEMVQVMIYQIWFFWFIALATQMIIFLNLIIAVLT